MSITEAPAVSTAPPKLVEGEWISAHDNLVLVGPTGVAQELAGLSAWPQSLSRQSVGHLSVGPRPRSRISRWPAATVLIPASYATSAEPTFSSSMIGGLSHSTRPARHDLLEILEERYGRRSTVITSQLPIDRWHEIIGDPTYADAILDRLIHNADRIELAGESLWLHTSKAIKEGLLDSLVTTIHRPARLATRAASFRYGGRHHSRYPGGIIPLYPGGFVGMARLDNLKAHKSPSGGNPGRGKTARYGHLLPTARTSTPSRWRFPN